MKGQIVIDTSKCPNAEKEQKTDKHLKCEACGFFFLHDKRGRKPSSCEWYRKLEKKEQVVRKGQRGEARKNSNMIPIPRLEPINSLDDLKPGMLVYTKASAFDGELQKLRFSSEYKVLSIEEDGVTILRNAKHGHKNYPVQVDVTRVFKNAGYDYVDKTDPDVEEEEEDD